MTEAIQHTGGLDLPIGLRALVTDNVPVGTIASIAGTPSPIDLGDPLVRAFSAAPAYPLAALGAVLAPAAAAIMERTQCAPATAANAVIAAASLAAQAHRDVRLPHGQVTPISLFIATICESGERKTSADQLALAAVREIEAEMRDGYRKAWPAFANHRDAYNAQRSQITTRKSDLATRRVALDDLGEEPKPPLSPYLIVPEARAMLAEVKTLAPGAIGALVGLEARVEALSHQVGIFIPANMAALSSAAEELKAQTQALLRFANDWHKLDRRREASENEIGSRWDVSDPFCQSILPTLEPIYAGLEDSWKLIGHKRTTVAELRGTLHDMEIHIVGLERIAGDLKRHHDASSSRTGSGGGPHHRRGSGYGPDGRDKGARAHADSKQHIWDFFGFRTRPTYEQCLARRNEMLKKHHPDIAGPAGAEMTRKIFDMWASAKDDLRVDLRV